MSKTKKPLGRPRLEPGSPALAVKRTSISIPTDLYDQSIASRVAKIKQQFPEYTFSDYIRDLLRKDQGLQTSAGF